MIKDNKATFERARDSILNALEALSSIAGFHWAIPELRRDLIASEKRLGIAINLEKDK